MYISYDYYRVFYYVARYRSFTQAANALMSNQPNVTRAIKTLEGELGCTLFIRSNRGVRLTPEGERLYSHIALAYEHIQAGEEEISLDKSLQKGVVTVGATEVALRCFLLPILKRFHELFPGIRIRVSNHSTPQALSALKNGLADLAVVTGEIETSRFFSVRSVKYIQDIPVCGSALSFLAEKPRTLAELTGYPIISLGPETKTFEFYSQWFLKNGLFLAPDIEAATTDQILPMVKSDLGIGFVPEEFIRAEADHRNLYALELETPIPQRPLCLVKQSGYLPSLAAKKLEEMILARN